MRVRDLVLAIGLVLLWVLSLKAEPYSPSCETALEKLHKAREALVPYRRTWLEPVNAGPMGK